MAGENENENKPDDEKEPDKEPDKKDDEPDGDFDKERALRTIRQQRESEKNLKLELDALKAEKKEAEDKEKSELQKLQERHDALEAENTKHKEEQKAQVTRSAFEDAAKKAGAINPTAVFKLAEGLELDDDGKPKNSSDVLKSLKSEYGFMFSGTNGKGDGGAGKGSDNGATDMNALLRRGRS